MDRFNLSAKDIKEGMVSVTNASTCWWAYRYWHQQLEVYEESLRNANDDEMICYYRYLVVEAKKVMVELYQKLIQMPEYSEGMLSKPDWMDEFLNTN